MDSIAGHRAILERLGVTSGAFQDDLILSRYPDLRLQARLEFVELAPNGGPCPRVRSSPGKSSCTGPSRIRMCRYNDVSRPQTLDDFVCSFEVGGSSLEVSVKVGLARERLPVPLVETS